MKRSSVAGSGNDDVTNQAQMVLEHILSETEEKEEAKRQAQMPVSQALNGEEVVHFESKRVKSRVLFITSDSSALKPESWMHNHVTNVHNLFEEVHVAVLQQGKKLEYPTKRLASNAWLYAVSFSSSWFLNRAIHNFAEAQLQFSGGFRPDVIVALDPYYAAMAGAALAKRYDRPQQIHVLEDFFEASFKNAAKENKEKVSVARYTLKRAKSVRTNSAIIKKKIIETFPNIEDVGMLPRHYETDALLKSPPNDVLKQKYPQYVFTILTVATLDHDNTVFRVIDAARTLLTSPRIGLIIVGDGPARSTLEERAAIFGIKEQVVFERNISVLHEYLLSANLFVTADTSDISEEYVMQAASAGMPMVLARTPLREDLFEDGESAFLCPSEDALAFSQKMNAVLNTNAFRMQLGVNAREVIKERLHTDPETYRAAYRDSIEVVFGNAALPTPRIGEDAAEIKAVTDVPTPEAEGESGSTDIPAATSRE